MTDTHRILAPARKTSLADIVSFAMALRGAR